MGRAVANVLLKRSKGENGGWITIATGWFVAVAIGVFVAQSSGSPGADVNPTVSLAKYLLHIYSFKLMLGNFLAQFLGAFVGAVLVYLVCLPHWRVTDPSNFLCEIIATVVLIIGVAAIFGKATLGHPVSGLGPYLVGVIVWGIGLSLGGPTGYAINPARDLGPRIAHAVLPILPVKVNRNGLMRGCQFLGLLLVV